MLPPEEQKHPPFAQANEQEKINALLCMARQSHTRARTVAGCPKTPPQVLSLLAQSPDKETRRLLTKNPNTPTHDLFELGAFFPRELWENPVFSLLRLEDPELLWRLPARTVRGLLSLDDLCVTLLSRAALSPLTWLRLATAKHPGLPTPLLHTLRMDKDPRVREAAGREHRDGGGYAGKHK